MKEPRKPSRRAPTSTCGAGSNMPRASSGSDEPFAADAFHAPPRPGSQLARACGRGCRTRIAQRDPNIRIGLRLPLHEAVSGLRPKQDVFSLVVEDELAFVRLDGEHGMPIALLVTHDGDEQRLTGPSGLRQHFALEQDVVLAVAVAVV